MVSTTHVFPYLENVCFRWYADSSVRRAMLSHSQEMQVRRAISSLEDRAVMSEQGPVIDAQVRKSVPKGWHRGYQYFQQTLFGTCFFCLKSHVV